jgi:ABC-2 type transport system ATP-binding protein
MALSLIAETQASGTTQNQQTHPPALALEHLCKYFGPRRAVHDLTLTIERGEIFGLLGPNGSGKTTTINVLCGLTEPSSGVARLLGLDVQQYSRRVRRLLGVVPQETALYEELSAWTNMVFHADLYGVPRKGRKERIERLLALVSLSDRKQSRVSSFSGGMKRRLAIARALLHDPQVLFLDEPTLGVDVQSRAALWTYIRALRTQGKTILLTTNYLEEAQQLCDRLAIIDHGELLVVDTPGRLRQRYGGSMIMAEVNTNGLLDLTAICALAGVEAASQEGNRVTIQVRGVETPLAEIMRLLAQQGEVVTLSHQEANLDDVFLRLTGSALRD